MNEIKNLESANFDHLELLAGGQQAICPGVKKKLHLHWWQRKNLSGDSKINICPGAKINNCHPSTKYEKQLLNKGKATPQNIKSNCSKNE